MNKNYYEILEVDKNASNEIIDKAYKILAKKYHPDLQDGINKEYEEKMKKINEAYAILSDESKRARYDEQLQRTTISLQQYQEIVEENRKLRQEIQRISNNNTNRTYNINSYNSQYEEQVNRAVNQAYHDAYVQDMKNRGYKIKYKRTFKQYIQLIIAILCIVFTCVLIYQIPFVKKFFNNLYNENIIIKAIVDIFVNTFTTKF